MDYIKSAIRGLISKIFENQVTRQNVEDQLKTIEDGINVEVYKRDRLITLLEAKLTELTETIDAKVAEKVKEIVKDLQDKAPFFVDPIIEELGDQVVKGVDQLTDKVVEEVVELAENLQEKLGLESPEVSEDETEGD